MRDGLCGAILYQGIPHSLLQQWARSEYDLTEEIDFKSVLISYSLQ